MNEGQESDYERLRKLGLCWSDAMEFTHMHPLGNTNIQHLRMYAEDKMKNFGPLKDSDTDYVSELISSAGYHRKQSNYTESIMHSNLAIAHMMWLNMTRTKEEPEGEQVSLRELHSILVSGHHGQLYRFKDVARELLARFDIREKNERV